MVESVKSMTIRGKRYEKVSLPGESLWVEVLEGPLMGTMVGRIDNDPISDKHNYKYGDVVRFGWVVREIDGAVYGCWEPE